MATQCPDLWGVRTDIAAFRDRASGKPFANWTSTFLDKQREALQDPVPATSGDLTATKDAAECARTAALAYVLTDEQAFADRAGDALEAVEQGAERWMFGGHADMYPEDRADLVTAEMVKSCASALSWAAPGLPDELQQSIIAMIAARGGEPIYDSAAHGCWWGNALNSNWTAVLNGGLGFAALVLRESDPETAATWLAFARDRMVEMLDLAAEEAAGVEGPGYWVYCFGSIQDFAEALYNVTGEDLFVHPFWDRCSRFLPYLALPDMSAWVNYADTAYRGVGGSCFFYGVAARKRDGLAQWFANRILEKRHGPDWKDLLYFDGSVPPVAIDEEPPCRFFRSIHLASFRSGWDDDAVFMMFKGGSNAWSHTHLDLNSFFITAYGERLATEPGPAPYSLAYWHSVEPAISTAWHNCLVVDAGHQRMAAQYAMGLDLDEAGDCYSRLDDYLDTDALALIRGDASSAYGDTLRKAWRDVVYLKPDVFVIFDDTLAHPVRCQRNYEWMLHSEHPMQRTDDGIEAQAEKARLLIQPVFPQDWEYKDVCGRAIAKGKDPIPLHAISIRPYWHHKWNINPSRSPYPHWDSRGDAEPLHTEDCQFLIVLSALKSGAPTRFAVESVEQSTAKGVILRNADETTMVLFNHDRQLIQLAGMSTDAEKAVVRDIRGHVSWAVVRGTALTWNAQTLLDEDTVVSRAV